MKKIVYYSLMMIMPFCVLNVSAQKKDISQAKEYIKKGKDLDKAEQLMTKLLKDSANRDNEKIWLVLFESISKQYQQGNEKLYLKQKYDTASLFNLAKKMFDTLESLDSLDMKPDKHGKVKLKYRDKNAQFLHEYRANLFYGGAYFLRKHKYDTAYGYFDDYLDCAEQPLFSRYKYQEKDKMVPRAAYWAVYCGYKMKNAKLTLKHSYSALKDTANYNYMLQYLAETYKLEEDTVRYIDALKDGFDRYPTFPFFFPRLVEYYTNKGNINEAMRITNKALTVDRNNVVFRFAKSSLLLSMEKYDDCIRLCDSLISENDTLADAYINAGLAYFNNAVKLDKYSQNSNKNRNNLLTYYKKALPYLQKYRILAPDQKKRWSLPLYTIYLKLNMGKEFDEIDKIIRTNK